MLEVLYSFICIAAMFLLYLIIGASYVPPWKMFKKPNVYFTLLILLFLGIPVALFLYFDEGFRKLVFPLLDAILP